jgi:hypothetical protein
MKAFKMNFFEQIKKFDKKVTKLKNEAKEKFDQKRKKKRFF